MKSYGVNVDDLMTDVDEDEIRLLSVHEFKFYIKPVVIPENLEIETPLSITWLMED